jgi:hypothetical protein
MGGDAFMKQARPLRRVVIKEEYALLTGDHVSAILLSQIEYWTMRTHDFDRFLAEEKSRAKTEGKETGVPFLHGWIYKTAEDLSTETMMGLSANTIRARLKRLVERGWIGERNNPDHSWDRTKQYRFSIGAVAADLERLGYRLEGWVFESEGLKPGKAHGSAIANFEDGNSKAEIGNATAEDRSSNLEDRTFENYGAIPEITTEIKDRDQQQPQPQPQPVNDHRLAPDQVSDEKDVVADDTPEIIAASEPVSHGPAQSGIQELIDFARDRSQEIILARDYAGEIIRRAGSLAAAKEKIEVASAFISKELRAGREINSVKGIMNRILQMNTGGIELGRSRRDVERRERFAKKEEKYRDIYAT